MPCDHRAKFVQNFFGSYRFFRDSQKMKNDRKRGRIKGFEDFNPNESYVSGVPGETRTPDRRLRADAPSSTSLLEEDGCVGATRSHFEDDFACCSILLSCWDIINRTPQHSRCPFLYKPIRRSPMRRGNSQLFQRSYCSLLYPAELLGHHRQNTPIFPLSALITK